MEVPADVSDLGIATVRLASGQYADILVPFPVARWEVFMAQMVTVASDAATDTDLTFKLHTAIIDGESGDYTEIGLAYAVRKTANASMTGEWTTNLRRVAKLRITCNVAGPITATVRVLLWGKKRCQ